MRKLIPCAMSFMLMFAAPVMAQTVDESAISELLHTTFDRPEAPLTRTDRSWRELCDCGMDTRRYGRPRASS